MYFKLQAWNNFLALLISLIYSNQHELPSFGVGGKELWWVTQLCLLYGVDRNNRNLWVAGGRVRRVERDLIKILPTPKEIDQQVKNWTIYLSVINRLNIYYTIIKTFTNNREVFMYDWHPTLQIPIFTFIYDFKSPFKSFVGGALSTITLPSGHP